MEFVIANVPKEKDPETRAEFFSQLGRIDTPECQALLFEEMKHGPTLGNRVAVAYQLRRTQSKVAMDAMIQEWHGLESICSLPDPENDSVPQIKSTEVMKPQIPENPYHLLSFLLSSDSPEAYRAVAEAWQRMDSGTRMQTLVLSHLGCRNGGYEDMERMSSETHDAIEKLVIHGLDDYTVFNGFTMSEHAASQLADEWPKKYHFNLLASPKQRAEQLAMVRRKAGLK
jgi:hypothetical protein